MSAEVNQAADSVEARSVAIPEAGRARQQPCSISVQPLQSIPEDLCPAKAGQSLGDLPPFRSPQSLLVDSIEEHMDQDDSKGGEEDQTRDDSSQPMTQP
jgi:hypothetical protein